jgi:hypothetical protein
MDKFKSSIGLGKKTSLAGWEAVAQRDDLEAGFNTMQPAPDMSPSASASPPALAPASAAQAVAARASSFFSSVASTLRLPSSASGPGTVTEMTAMGPSAAGHMLPPTPFSSSSSSTAAVPSAADGDADGDDGAGESSGFLTSLSARTAAGAKGAMVSLSAALPDLSYPQRLAGFTLSLCAGGVMLFMCTTMLPGLFLGAAAKFAFAYAFANVFIGLAPCFLSGPVGQLESTFAEGRRVTALVYFASLTLLLFACMTAPTVFVVLPVLLVQVCALIWYVFSYLPCGTGGLNSVAGSFASATVGAALPRSVASVLGL